MALRRSALRVDPEGELRGVVRRVVTVSDALHLEVDVEGVGRMPVLAADRGPEVGDDVRLAVDPRGVAHLPE